VISAVGKDEIVEAFTATLSSVIPYCTCAITLVDPVTGNSSVTNAVGQNWMSLVGRSVAPGEGVTGWVLANRKPFCNADPKLDLPPSVIKQFPDYRTLAVFPIINDSVMYGAVTVYSSALARYTQAHQKLMKEAVALMAAALGATTHSNTREKRQSADDDGLSPFAETGSSLGLGETVQEHELTH